MHKTKDDWVNSPNLNAPYLIFLGDTKEHVDAKTGLGLVQWCREKVIGQWRFDDCLVDLGRQTNPPPLKHLD